ncbi:unnamed protein product [Adineta ricciae]|uniref:Calcineurin-like phosphoesterase domain-containing protein n=1 Tax=Adineta ricciae TaxID=249248 RepID=A0A814WV19_ADIRI|nr:unnamed protein product [Adineta ricciae]
MCRRTRLTTRLKRLLISRYGFVLLTACLVVCMNEIVCYEWMVMTWPNIDSLANKSTVRKFLLVADPQLIGEKDEGFFGLITRNDADRYLANTFSRANSYVKPDGILFLGDIFDEGLSATDDEFKRYFNRFDSIFQYKSRGNKSIVIPGDNDVGGEYYGDKNPYQRQRFSSYFGRMIQLYRQKDIEILRLDIDLRDDYLKTKQSRVLKETQSRPMTSAFRIVLNHWPMLTRSASFTKSFLHDLNPNLILKGDSHHFTIYLHDRDRSVTEILAREFLPQPVLSIDVAQTRYVHEISIPTCSYRMGVSRIGYGVLLLDTATKSAHLTILSTPRRYGYLYAYATYGICFVIGVIFIFLCSGRSITTYPRS